MTAHLATVDGVLCATPARRPARSGDLRVVTCTRCARRLDVVTREEDAAAFERRMLDRYRRACEAVGIAHLWQRVAGAQTPTERMLRDVLGAVALAFEEYAT